MYEFVLGSAYWIDMTKVCYATQQNQSTTAGGETRAACPAPFHRIYPILVCAEGSWPRNFDRAYAQSGTVNL